MICSSVYSKHNDEPFRSFQIICRARWKEKKCSTVCNYRLKKLVQIIMWSLRKVQNEVYLKEVRASNASTGVN